MSEYDYNNDYDAQSSEGGEERQYGWDDDDRAYDAENSEVMKSEAVIEDDSYDLFVSDLLDAPLATQAGNAEDELINADKRIVSYCLNNFRNNKNAMRFDRYTLHFAPSDSYKASSPNFPDQYHKLGLLDNASESCAASATFPPSVLENFDSNELPHLCKAYIARDQTVELGMSRSLEELKLLNKTSASMSKLAGPLAIFLRGEDNAGRYKTLNNVLTGLKLGSSSSDGIDTAPRSLSRFEDALLKANFVMRSLTQYRKFHFKNDNSDGSFDYISKGGMVEPVATPVSAAISKFSLEIDANTSEISKVDMSCVMLDYKVLMGRIMKTDSNFLNFNIFYDLVNEISELDIDLYKELGFMPSSQPVSRAKLATRFDLLNKPLFHYLLRLHDTGMYFSNSTSSQQLFDLANIPSLAPTYSSEEFTLNTNLRHIFSCLSDLNFSSDDLRAICKILAAILHLGNINPAEASSSIFKGKRRGGVPLPYSSAINNEAIKSGGYWHIRENSFSCGLVSSSELADLLGIDELHFRDLILSKHDIHDAKGVGKDDKSVQGDEFNLSGSAFDDILKHLGVKGDEFDDFNDFDDESVDLEFVQHKIDTLIKLLYQKLLQWVVSKINNHFNSLSQINGASSGVNSSNYSNSYSNNNSNKSKSSKGPHDANAKPDTRSLVIVDVPSVRACSHSNGSKYDIGNVYDLAINYINDSISCVTARDSLKLKYALDDYISELKSSDRDPVLASIIESTTSWLKRSHYFRTCLDSKPDGLLSFLNLYSKNRLSGLDGPVNDVSFLIAAIDAQTSFRGVGPAVKNVARCGFYSNKNGFMVSHVHGDVKYDIKGILAANMDYSSIVSSKLDSIISRSSFKNTVIDALLCKPDGEIKLRDSDLNYTNRKSRPTINNINDTSNGNSNTKNSRAGISIAASRNAWRCGNEGESIADLALRVVSGIDDIISGAFHYEVFINIAVNDPLQEVVSTGGQIGDSYYSDGQPAALSVINFNRNVVSRQLSQNNIQKSYLFIQAKYPFRCDIIELYDSLWQFIEFYRLKQSHDCSDSSELLGYVFQVIKGIFPLESYYVSDFHIYFETDPDTYISMALDELGDVCARKIQHVYNGFEKRRRYLRFLRAIYSIQTLFRNRMARAVLSSALELSDSCQVDGVDNNAVLNMVYRNDSVSPIAVVNAIYLVRHKLRCILRNQMLFHEVEGLNSAVEAGDLSLLRGYLGSLTKEEKLEKLAIRDKKFSFRTVFHSAIIGGSIGVIKELGFDLDSLLAKDSQSNSLIHMTLFTPNPAVTRYLHKVLQKQASKCMNDQRNLLRLLYSEQSTMSGWMMKLNRLNTWQARWFIVKNSYLRYYKASFDTTIDKFEDEILLSPTTCYMEAYEFQSLASTKGLKNPKPYTIVIKLNSGCQSKRGRSMFTLSLKTHSEFYRWLDALSRSGCRITPFISSDGTAENSGLYFDDSNLSRLWVSEKNVDLQTAVHVMALADSDIDETADNDSVAPSENSEFSIRSRQRRLQTTAEKINNNVALNILSVVCILISMGCPINAVDAYGKTALSVAIDDSNQDLVSTLIARGAHTAEIPGAGESKAVKAAKNEESNFSQLLNYYYSCNKARLERVEAPVPLVAGLSYLSLYIDRLVWSAKASKFLAMITPYLIVRICDQSLNVLDEYISPFPVSCRSNSAMLFGYALKILTPLEILPDKFLIKIFLKDFNPAKPSDISMCEGFIALNKQSLSYDDFKPIKLTDAGDALQCQLTIDATFICEEPKIIPDNAWDHIETANLTSKYLESIGSKHLTEQNIEEIKGILLNQETYLGLKVVHCLGLDVEDSEWTWFVTSAHEDVLAGELLSSVGGLEGVDAVPSCDLVQGQKIIVLAPAATSFNQVDARDIAKANFKL